MLEVSTRHSSFERSLTSAWTDSAGNVSLQLMVNRTKRKRRRKKMEKGAALTGSERVKVKDLRTGKKVSKANLLRNVAG